MGCGFLALHGTLKGITHACVTFLLFLNMYNCKVTVSSKHSYMISFHCTLNSLNFSGFSTYLPVPNSHQCTLIINPPNKEKKSSTDAILADECSPTYVGFRRSTAHYSYRNMVHHNIMKRITVTCGYRQDRSVHT